MKSVTVALGAVLLACAARTPMALAATEAEKRAAIQAGLAYLYHTQQAEGHWSSSGYEQPATGAAAFAFLSQQDKWGGNAALYQAAVDRAIAYLLRNANTLSVSTRNDGVNICPGGSASCEGVYWYGNAESTYTTGLIAPAVATYGVKVGANVVATTSGPLAGMTWRQIAQGITNAFAASQSTSGNGDRAGGWRYIIPGNGDSATSGTQWAVISFLYDETLGAATPQVVKDDLKLWLANVQNASGAVCYQPGTEPCDHADTGDWLLAMKFVGYDLTNSQLQAALAFLNRYWQVTANNLWYGNFGHPYAMWAVYKGLETTIGLSDTTHISNLLTDCGATTGQITGNSSGSGPCTWSEDYSQWLVKNQNIDGSFGGYSYWTDSLATAFYVNVLGATRIPVVTHKCPADQGFWRSTPGVWPVASLNLGGQTYSKQELLVILNTPIGSGMSADASLILADELIGAKLNLARGSEAVPVTGTIADADSLFSRFNGKLPYHVAPSSLIGRKMADDGKVLATYNNGSLTPGCIAATEMAKGSTTERTQATPQVHRPTALATGGRTSSRAVASTASAQVTQVTVSSTKLRPRVRKGVTALAVNGDGSALASGATDNRIRIWSATTGLNLLALPSVLGLPTGLAYSPIGGSLASVGRDSLVRVWDPASGSQLATLAGHEHAIRAVAVSPDGKFLASAGEESRIMLWDLTTRKLSKILFGPTDFVNALSFSPDSRLLASAGEDARVLLFDIAAGKSLYTLRGHSAPIDAVAFSPDGTVLASGGQDTVIHLWNPVNGQQRHLLKGHSAPIRTITFSRDGQSIASGGEDALIILWNAANGVMNKTLLGSTGFINVLAFGPAGRFLASATDAGEIALWNVITGAKVLSITVPTAP